VRFSRIAAPTLLILISAALLIHLPAAIAQRTSDYAWFDPLLDIRQILLRHHVEEPDVEQMHRGSIQGMIAALEDPYTEFVPPVDEAEFNKQVRGMYAGIGAEVNLIDGYLTIISPMDDSPALKAGVLAGDTVIEIEGKGTHGLPVDECVALLTGEAGTPVRLKVRHLDGVEQDLTIVRDHIVTRTVKGLWRTGLDWHHCVDGELGICYVKVTQFNAATVDELVQALDRCQSQGLNGLILDLRDNPGGGLPVAVGMADLFLSKGEIVSVHPRVGNVDTYSAATDGTLPEFPMIVLVNGLSASASEIVAGALQENGRAKVLGTRSFGKGSVQEVRSLEYGAGTLKYTTAYYHLPSGRVLHRRPESADWGVDPDSGFLVPVSDADYRQSLIARRDFEVIREDGRQNPGPEDRCATPQWVRETLHDEQLAVAIERLGDRLRGADWPAATAQDAGVVAMSQELERASRAREDLLNRLDELETRMLELQGLAQESGRKNALPEGITLEGGVIELRDRLGNLVGRYRVESGDLGLALESVDLTPLGASEAPAPSP